MSSSTAPAIALQDLPGLRSKTERISEALRQQLAGHLETLRPIYAPERVFGKLTGGKVEVALAERALGDLKAKYKTLQGGSLPLPSEFDLHWLTLTGSALELIPWEYTHEIAGKGIKMTSPVRWVVNYKSGITIEKLRAALAGGEAARSEAVRQFAVNSLVLQTVLGFSPGFAGLFADLRYELKIESPPEFKGLPLLTVTSCLHTFRPADELISAAVAFSGVPAFVELMDIEASKSPRDLLKERIEQLVA